MLPSCSLVSLRWLRIAMGLSLSLSVAFAQKSAPPGKSNVPNAPTSPFPADTTTLRPIYVSGNVVLQGGMPVQEPVAIERVCNGVVRREGYTDSKGRFEIELGHQVEQDASEGDFRATNSRQQSLAAGASILSRYEGCELTALLPGFRSTSVMLHVDNDFERVQAGTIVLSRQEGVQGTTISVSSLSAPKGAREAYEKGRRAGTEKKFAEAEKELKKAVEIFPRYAAAWFLLGELHRMQKQPEQAKSEYSEAISCDSQFLSPYYGLTVIALDERNWREVVRRTGELTRLNEFAYPGAFYFNSVANYSLGQMDAAEQSARKFQSMDPDHHTPEVFRLLAKVLEAKKDYAGAVQQLRDYLALVPASPQAEEIRADAKRLEDLSSAKK